MRIIGEKNLPNGLKATIFSWNGKFLIKFENGAFEQTYKVSETDIAGLADIHQWIDNPGFQEKIQAVFLQMEENLDGIW